MKRTIKKDLERNVIKRELLNDNTLLEYVAEKRDILVSVRFVESPISGIKEHVLLKMDVADFTDHIGKILEISEKKDAIAIFKPVGEEYHLEQVYDTEEHHFAIGEFVDLAYKRKFPKQPLKNAYRKTK